MVKILTITLACSFFKYQNMKEKSGITDLQNMICSFSPLIEGITAEEDLGIGNVISDPKKNNSGLVMLVKALRF